MKKNYFLALIFISVLINSGCHKDDQLQLSDNTTAQAVTVADLNNEEDVFAFLAANEPDIFTQSEIKRVKEMLTAGDLNITPRAKGKTVNLPAGSVDALQAAVEEAGSGGTVIVEAGEHIENSRVNILFGINIIGEKGAVIKLGIEETPDFTIVIDGGILLSGADKSMIKNIDFQPVGNNARIGIMVYQSNMVTIQNNSFTDIQFAVNIDRSNHTNVRNNTITIGIPLIGPLGITVINGHSTSIVGNHISGAQFGIWCCDKSGVSWGNTTNNCLYGQILCKVPAESLSLDGELIGADRPGSNWLLAMNEASDNIYAGIVAIDGAAKNVLLANTGSNNGAYDVDLVGDSYRFGFLTPTSEKNRVYSYSDQVIKDCGEKNRVQGGIQVDTETDPCN